MTELADTVLDRRFRILYRIGSGGMGEVWAARDTLNGASVAVKVMRGKYANEADLVERFHREARAISAVRHENVVVVYASGTDKASGTHYIAMELLVGETLRALMKKGALPLPDANALAAQILSGLAAAHDAGIITVT